MPFMPGNTSRFPIKEMKYLYEYGIMYLQSDMLYTEKRNYGRER